MIEKRTANKRAYKMMFLVDVSFTVSPQIVEFVVIQPYHPLKINSIGSSIAMPNVSTTHLSW
ncbi:hypothetical protein J2S05_003220 [Alkalicoccobacillus murimartini]|uniref:Uncharacterized protein n=1 Tax=Alkalicoccobacillus murimartini TaxID=171685 RepID=A0ABT9YN19_9BACI|nr:hypothetical protein [Alkalicoccobacillus murimartini]